MEANNNTQQAPNKQNNIPLAGRRWMDIRSTARPVSLSSQAYAKKNISSTAADSNVTSAAPSAPGPAIDIAATKTPRPIMLNHWTWPKPTSRLVLIVLAGLLFVIGLAAAGYQIWVDVRLKQHMTKSTVTNTTAASTNAAIDEANVDINKLDESEPATSPPAAGQRSTGIAAPDWQPVAFRAPSIKINAYIGSVGLDKNGVLNVPRNIYTVGYYGGSSKLTDTAGAILLLGHVTGPYHNGIFFNLKDIQIGQIVEVQGGGGLVKKFKVVEKIQQPADKLDMTKAITSAHTSKLGLNIITCGGKLDKSQTSYLDRILVRAVAL